MRSHSGSLQAQSRFTWSGRREAQPPLLLLLRIQGKMSATVAVGTFLSKEQIWGWVAMRRMLVVWSEGIAVPRALDGPCSKPGGPPVITSLGEGSQCQPHRMGTGTGSSLSGV